MDIDKLRSAYSKFKSYIFYDNFNLHLRYKMSEFEADRLDNKMEDLLSAINEFIEKGDSPRISKWINESGYLIVPKSFAEPKRNESQLISNTGETGTIPVSRVTVLYDAPIELFIISTLWTVDAKKYLKISPDSYGYVLPHNDGQRLLFEPYFNKYQEWRDKGINAAKQQIGQRNNVLFVTLDIKNFFHSANIDFSKLKESFPMNAENEFVKLTDIIEKICIDHTRKIIADRERAPILPIGLPSSGIIANWLLADFDRDVKSATAPIYYGRYVDDIFIVISNVEPPADTQMDKWLCGRFFPNGDIIKMDGDDLSITSNRCTGLKIQKNKLRLFYFDAQWSLALLNKFQTTIQENSSAFWFLPNEEDLLDSLDDTFDLQYEDTINKFRSISSCKANKYRASVFLAKRLKLAILSSDSVDPNLESEIFRFFNGRSIISMYSMWEKVFTYFSITHNLKAINSLRRKIISALDRIETAGDMPYNINAENILKRLRQNLEDHMDYCLMLAKTFVKGSIGLPEFKGRISNGATLFKRALLTRQYLLPLPIVALTPTFINKEIDIIGLQVADLKDHIASYILKHLWIIPRHINLHEICTLCIPITQYKGYPTKIGQIYKDDFWETVTSTYEKLNGYNLKQVMKLTEYKRFSERSAPHKSKVRLLSEKIAICDKKTVNKISIGISNVNTSERDVEEAIVNQSNLDASKRKRHIDILNQSEKLKVDMLLLPEVFVPLNWVCAYADEAKRKQRAMIFGIEHFTIKNKCYNIAVTILPFEFYGHKEAMIIPRLKNHYSPSETFSVEGNRKYVPKLPYSIYHLYQWHGLQFSVYNCFELTDIVHRSLFRSELDIMFAIEYNKDITYFSNISESVSRDLHCYYVQANTSFYGDSRVVEPKKTLYMNPVRVKGGLNDVILKYELDIESLRKFQTKTYILQKDDKQFKMTPPDFQNEKVKTRGQI